MTENQNTDNQPSETPEPKRYGFDAREVFAKHRKAGRAARRTYEAAVAQSRQPLDAVDDALRMLLPDVGDTYGQAHAVFSLVETMSRAQRSKLQDAAQDTLNLALDAARAERDRALGDDPFTKFIADEILGSYSSDITDRVFESLPATIDEMKELANKFRWCSDFESVMERAVRAGILPSETAEITVHVPQGYVPRKYDPHPDEYWTATFQLPVYFRTVNQYGPVEYSDLRYHTVGEITYAKGEKPEDHDPEMPF